MSKGAIADPLVLFEPSQKFFDYIGTLHNEPAMPANVLAIYKLSSCKSAADKTILSKELGDAALSKTELQLIATANEQFANTDVPLDKLIQEGDTDTDTSDYEHDIETVTAKPTKAQAKRQRAQANRALQKSLTLNLNDLRWLTLVLDKERDQDTNTSKPLYLHELLQESKLILPKNAIIPRSTVLEERCVKLRAQQASREYHAMTKDVDPRRQNLPEETIAYQMKQINRQLVAVLQFIFSVAAGFAFGFIGVELLIGGLDFGFRLLLGIMCSLIIALAEIYFLAKKLNEDDFPVDVDEALANPDAKVNAKTEVPPPSSSSSSSPSPKETGTKAHAE